MAKSAVLAFTQTLAREVGPEGITVNAVSPGMTLTEFSETLPAATKETVRMQTPLRRLATPDDVARAVVFFCSPLAAFITGGQPRPGRRVGSSVKMLRLGEKMNFCGGGVS